MEWWESMKDAVGTFQEEMGITPKSIKKLSDCIPFVVYFSLVFSVIKFYFIFLMDYLFIPY